MEHPADIQCLLGVSFLVAVDVVQSRHFTVYGSVRDEVRRKMKTGAKNAKSDVCLSDGGKRGMGTSERLVVS